MAQEWITSTEAAKISGYHPDYIRKLLQNGKIVGQKFGTVWQIDRASLEGYLARMKVKGQRRGPKPGSQE